MHYTYIIYYIDSVYTYVVFVQIDKYIYTRVCEHVQIHRDVLETICTTHRCWGLRLMQAGASWNESLFCFGHLNHFQGTPSPVLADALASQWWEIIRGTSAFIYIAFMNRLLVESRKTAYFYRLI